MAVPENIQQNTPIKSLLVGRGYWGTILERYMKDCSFEPVTVYSRSSGISFAEALEQSGAECVFICSPVSSHYEYAREALLAGRHVFCEKMLTGDTAKAEELYRIAEDQDRILFTDYIYLYSPSVRKMKEVMASLGKCRHIDASICQFGRFYSDVDVIGNIGVHMISAAGLMTGFAPWEQTAAGFCMFIDGVPEDACISCTAGGVRITIRASVISGEKIRRIRVLCDGGEMVFDMMSDKSLTLNRFIKCGSDELRLQSETFAFDEFNNISKSLAAFGQCINDPRGAVYAENRECSMYVERHAASTFDKIHFRCDNL